MNTRHGLLLALLCAGSFGAAFAVTACDTETATKAVVANAYPTPPDAAFRLPANTVYRVWWSATYFANPVNPGESSEEERTVPSTATAYAVIAPGWNPTGTTPPTSLIVLQSKSGLSVKRGDTLTISIDDTTFAGNCSSNQPLPQDAADFITDRIFPGDFGGRSYDAKTCTLTGAGDTDAGADANANAADAGDD